MNIKASLKQIKPLHWINNILHYGSLRHNRDAYKKYGINKSLFSSISSRDFPDKSSKAWLDVGNSALCVQDKEAFSRFSKDVQSQLINWSRNGYMILPAHFTAAETDTINKAANHLIIEKGHSLTHDNKLLYGYKHSSAINNMMRDKRLIDLLSFILGKEVVPFQTLNFIKGSGQRAHSDSIHMTTYPLGYLIAAWIALEDIHPESGPLFYYPGSHSLPYLLNDDFENYSTRFLLGNKKYADYEDVIEDILKYSSFEKKIFLPKKGDVLIWHANLIHGGMPVINPSLTRKSMVIHYYAADVIKYHEITERPSLLEE
jgi:ectoine hydroxylase-related dioxygenase (phytanoyl-CoA dioxygenase family)